MKTNIECVSPKVCTSKWKKNICHRRYTFHQTLLAQKTDVFLPAQLSSDHINLFTNDKYCFVSVFIIAVDQKRFNTISFFYSLPQLFHYPHFPSSLFKIEHLYGLTVFENYLYATNSDNANMQPKTSVIRVNRFNSTDYQVVTRVDKGGALHVYHQRRQPPGRPHTLILTRFHFSGTSE